MEGTNNKIKTVNAGMKVYRQAGAKVYHPTAIGRAPNGALLV